MNIDLEKAGDIFRFLCEESAEMDYMVIEGEPYSKARPRFSSKGGVYSSKKQRANEAYIKLFLKRHFKKPKTSNVAIGMIFYRSTRQRIDVDNMIKNVMDAANGIIFIDDSQVTAKLGILELDSERPRTVIVVGNHKSTMNRDTVKEIVCKNCKKIFANKDGFIKRKDYCSRTCVSEGRKNDNKKKLKPCEECKKDFLPKTKNQKLCSVVCRQLNMSKRRKRGGIHNKAFCDKCNKELSKPTYKRCRGCWVKDTK